MNDIIACAGQNRIVACARFDAVVIAHLADENGIIAVHHIAIGITHIARVDQITARRAADDAVAVGDGGGFDVREGQLRAVKEGDGAVFGVQLVIDDVLHARELHGIAAGLAAFAAVDREVGAI